MPTILLSNPLGADDAERIGLPDVREYGVGELITVDDFVSYTLIRTGYGTAVGYITDILIVGTGTPPGTIGADGQWYLDTYSEVLWGPKVSGSWPTDPIRPDRGVGHLAIDSNGHLQVTYSTGTVVDLGNVIGPANVLTTGPVTTLAPGQPAAATIKNTGVGQQELDLSIPQGAKGDAATIAVGTVTTGAAGSNATVTNRGTSAAAIFDIAIPRGNTGLTGRGFLPRGAWAATTAYAVDDLFTQNGSTYHVTTGYTSGASFGATDTANTEVWSAAGAMADATPTAKGAIKLAGALGGTADLPTIAIAGQANGVASLDGNGKVPAAQIPAGATGSDQGSVTVDTASSPGSAIVNLTGNWGLTDALANLVPNPAPASTTGYTANAGSGGAGALSFLATGGPTGAGAVRYTWTTANNTAAGTSPGVSLRADGRGSAQPLPIPVVPGQVYSIAVQARCSVAQRLSAELWWFAADGSNPSSVAGTPTVVTAGAWTQLTLANVVAPAGAVYCMVGVITQTGTGCVPMPVGATLDAAQLQLEATDTVHAYFDGTTGGGAWTGTANASTSTKPAQVYYDPAGATASEAGLLVPDPDGNGFSIFRPGGPWTSEDARVAAFVADTTSRLRAALDALYAGGLAYDTGWLDLTVNTGFAVLSTAERPQVRRVGKLVKLRGGVSNTGLSASATSDVCTLPAGIPAPPQNVIVGLGSSSGAATAGGWVTASTGLVSVRTSATLGAYYKFDALSYWID